MASLVRPNSAAGQPIALVKPSVVSIALVRPAPLMEPVAQGNVGVLDFSNPANSALLAALGLI